MYYDVNLGIDANQGKKKVLPWTPQTNCWKGFSYPPLHKLAHRYYGEATSHRYYKASSRHYWRRSNFRILNDHTTTGEVHDPHHQKALISSFNTTWGFRQLHGKPALVALRWARPSAFKTHCTGFKKDWRLYLIDTSRPTWEWLPSTAVVASAPTVSYSPFTGTFALHR